MARHDDYDDAFEALALLAYQVAFRLTGDRADAEDVAQETMARAYLRWSRVRGYAEAWVVRVATNQVIGSWRRRRPHQEIPDPTGPVVDDAVATRLALTEALRSLPRRQREVAVLRYLGDLSIESTAEAMGCSISSVKAHSSRALDALRRHEALRRDESTSAIPSTTRIPTTRASVGSLSTESPMPAVISSRSGSQQAARSAAPPRKDS